MALVTLEPLLAKAESGRYAVGAFNINTDMQAEAIFQAAYDLNSPLIIQASKGACAFQGWKGDKKEELIETTLRGARRIKQIAEMVAEDYPGLDYALHLDHGPSFEVAKACIDSGFSSVMIDGSHLTLDENIELTKRVVDYAHEMGRTVEGELGTLGGKDHSGSSGDIIYTKPEEVVEFVSKTGVDALAICWGTRHGPNKFAKGDMDLRPEVIRACYQALQDEALTCYIVSHGSSTVPKKYVDQINQYGGNIESSGVPLEQVEVAIRFGARKINIDTDLRLAKTGMIRQILDQKRDTIDPRDYLKPGRQAMYETVKDSIMMFGSDGQGGL
jgi:fructose-bisphosphate aldolase class II